MEDSTCAKADESKPVCDVGNTRQCLGSYNDPYKYGLNETERRRGSIRFKDKFEYVINIKEGKEFPTPDYMLKDCKILRVKKQMT